MVHTYFSKTPWEEILHSKDFEFDFEIWFWDLKNGNIYLLIIGTSDSQRLVVIFMAPDVFFPKWN